MRPSLPCLALAASLSGALPALSAEDAKPAAPALSPLADAAFTALGEIEAADDPDASLPARFERLGAFRYSPQTAAKLARTFGTERPFTVTRVPGAKNQLVYRADLVPLHYVGADGASADWSALSVLMSTDHAGRRVAVNGSWPSIDAQDKNTRFALRHLTLAGQQHRGFGGLWFGTARLDIERMSIEPKAAVIPGLVFEGIHTDTTMTERPRGVDLHYGGAVKAVHAGSERIDDVRWAVRIDNIDKRALVALKAASEKNKAALAAPTAQRRVAAAQPMLMDFARAMVARGAAIEIDDISAGYQGSRASIKGRISVEGATGAGLDTMAAVLRKIVARFEVKVPLALVRAVSARVAQKQLETQHPGTPADPQAAAQMGQTVADVMVGKLINGGYARIDNDALVSTIEWRDGSLRANGKEIALPKPPQQAVRTPLLQARRIADSCKLPDYPDDVVRQDAPLQLTLRFVVGADGHLRKLALAQASQWPAYDQAVLAAAAECAYIPALRNGQPVEVPMTWPVVREPGSVRP